MVGNADIVAVGDIGMMDEVCPTIVLEWTGRIELTAPEGLIWGMALMGIAGDMSGAMMMPGSHIDVGVVTGDTKVVALLLFTFCGILLGATIFSHIPDVAIAADGLCENMGTEVVRPTRPHGL